MKRWNFDRYRGAQLMAEGVAVHAGSLEEALGKVSFMQRIDGELVFVGNDPCVSQCGICELAGRGSVD